MGQIDNEGRPFETPDLPTSRYTSLIERLAGIDSDIEVPIPASQPLINPLTPAVPGDGRRDWSESSEAQEEALSRPFQGLERLFQRAAAAPAEAANKQPLSKAEHEPLIPDVEVTAPPSSSTPRFRFTKQPATPAEAPLEKTAVDEHAAPEGVVEQLILLTPWMDDETNKSYYGRIDKLLIEKGYSPIFAEEE
ncbi:MAG: hypothetical protein ABR973_06175 [Candidatus Acidiferrales bacterium]|jgi:hypothetical protein